jgi:hypothetical protein
MSENYANNLENYDSWAPRFYRDFISLLNVNDISPSAASYFYICFLAMNLDEKCDEEDIRDFLRSVYESLIDVLQMKKQEKETNR